MLERDSIYVIFWWYVILKIYWIGVSERGNMRECGGKGFSKF